MLQRLEKKGLHQRVGKLHYFHLTHCVAASGSPAFTGFPPSINVHRLARRCNTHQQSNLWHAEQPSFHN